MVCGFKFGSLFVFYLSPVTFSQHHAALIHGPGQGPGPSFASTDDWPPDETDPGIPSRIYGHEVSVDSDQH